MKMDTSTRLEKRHLKASPGLTKFYKDEILKEGDKDKTWNSLDSGSFGNIHIVNRVRGFGKVVVKEFKPSKRDRERLRQLEERELEFVLKLSHHPNILTFYGYLYRNSSSNERIGFVTEHMENKDLRTFIYSDFPYEENRVLNFALHAARGLAFCHDNGLVHRDVKPDNMLLSSGATILKICDFGLSNERSGIATACIGTVIYMAPEVMETENYDYTCDVYSLALTIWEMYHKRSPATDKNGIDYRKKVQTGKRPTFEDCKIHMEEDIPTLIRSSWENDPEKRWNMNEVLDFLEKKCATLDDVQDIRW